jgi:hypothetical protein
MRIEEELSKMAQIFYGMKGRNENGKRRVIARDG